MRVHQSLKIKNKSSRSQGYWKIEKYKEIKLRGGIESSRQMFTLLRCFWPRTNNSGANTLSTTPSLRMLHIHMDVKVIWAEFDHVASGPDEEDKALQAANRSSPILKTSSETKRSHENQFFIFYFVSIPRVLAEKTIIFQLLLFTYCIWLR